VKVGGDAFAKLVELVPRHQAAAFDDEHRDQKREAENDGGAPGRVQFAFRSKLAMNRAQRGQFTLDPPAFVELPEPGGYRDDWFFRSEAVGQGADLSGCRAMAADHRPLVGEICAHRPNFDFRERVDFLIANQIRADPGEPDALRHFPVQRNHQRGHAAGSGEGIAPLIDQLFRLIVGTPHVHIDRVRKHRRFEGSAELIGKQHQPVQCGGRIQLDRPGNAVIGSGHRDALADVLFGHQSVLPDAERGLAVGECSRIPNPGCVQAADTGDGGSEGNRFAVGDDCDFGQPEQIEHALVVALVHR